MAGAACLLALSLLVVAGSACGGEDEPPLPEGEVRIATGLPGGVYRIYGQSLAGVINRHLKPLRASARMTPGSVENLKRLDRGEAEMAFTLADSAAPAIAGQPPFSGRVPIAALARLYDDYVQVIARAQSGWSSVRDLAGKTISIGARGSGTALTARRILRLQSLGLRGSRAPVTLQLDLEESANALAAGRIDAFFWSGGLPTEAIQKLRDKVKITLLELPAGTAAALDPNLFTQSAIPQYVYGGDRAVTTVAAANLLVVRGDMPEETAYRLTRALFEHHDEFKGAHEEARRLNPRKAIATYPVGLHPGARRWYREPPE